MTTYKSISTEKLEARDFQLTKQAQALKAWSNRALSNKARQECLANIRKEQDAILVELMNRQGAN